MKPQGRQVTFSSNVLFREVDGEAVLLDAGSGVYFGLDKLGTAIWNYLKEKKGFEEIVRAITQEFDVSQEQCREDLKNFIQKLEKNRLLSTHGD